MNTPGKLCRILVFSLCSFLLFVTLRHSNCFDFFGLSAMSLLLSKSSWLCLSFSSWYQFWKLSKQFSHSFMSDSLWPHGLQHAWFPCSSPTPWAYSNSCPSSWWCHPTISSSVAPFPPALNLSHCEVFSSESVLRIRWPKYWSFSTSLSNEYSGLISFRIDWFWSPCSPTDCQESCLTPQFKSINSLALSFLYNSTLTSVLLGKTIA